METGDTGEAVYGYLWWETGDAGKASPSTAMGYKIQTPLLSLMEKNIL